MLGLADSMYVPWPSKFHFICCLTTAINPYMTNGLDHHYHLGESTFISRGFRGDFKILFHFSMKSFSVNRIAPDGTPHSGVSHLGLFCFAYGP